MAVRFAGSYRARKTLRGYILEDRWIHPLPGGREGVWGGMVAIAGKVSLSGAGVLVALPGWTWDGPSGPTVDSQDGMRAAFIHDCLYHLMRSGQIPQGYRPLADREFRRILREDGMTWFRSTYWWAAVRLFAASAARPKGD